MLFQAQSLAEDEFEFIYIDRPVRYECNNTVSNVQSIYGPVDPIYQIPPLLSRMLAGMLGWSSTPPNGTIEYELYQEAGQIGWSSAPTLQDVLIYVSSFTAGGIATMDGKTGSSASAGLSRMYVDNGRQPIQAQIMVVKWWAAGTILALVPFVHFWTLILVIFFANKVIIKDDSPLAVAKIYHSLLNKVGDQHGCMLTGDQLIEVLEQDHEVPKVIYGTMDRGNGIRHVDVFEEGSGVKSERIFPEGNYDGSGTRRRLHRTFNAHDYF